MAIGTAAAVATAVSAIGSTIANNVAKKKAEEREVERQQQEVNRVSAREDTSVSRGTRDALASGIDPRVNGSSPVSAGSQTVTPTVAREGDYSGFASGGQALGDQLLNQEALDIQQENNEFTRSREMMGQLYDNVNRDLELVNTDIDRYEGIKQKYEELLKETYSDYSGGSSEISKDVRKVTQNEINKFLQNHENYRLGLNVGASKGNQKGHSNDKTKGSSSQSTADSRSDRSTREGQKDTYKVESSGRDLGGDRIRTHSFEDSASSSEKSSTTVSEGSSILDKISNIVSFSVNGELSGSIDWGKLTGEDKKQLTSDIVDSLTKTMSEKSKTFNKLDDETKRRIIMRLSENDLQLDNAYSWRTLYRSQKSEYNKASREMFNKMQSQRYRSLSVGDLFGVGYDGDTLYIEKY